MTLSATLKGRVSLGDKNGRIMQQGKKRKTDGEFRS